MKYQFIAGPYHGIVEADSEDEAMEKLRSKPELVEVKNILLKKVEEEG